MKCITGLTHMSIDYRADDLNLIIHIYCFKHSISASSGCNLVFRDHEEVLAGAY